MLEIEANFVETLLGNEIFAFRTKISAVNDGIDKLIVGTKISGTFDTPDSFEAQGVPYAARCNVGFVNQVENGVCVALRS